MSVKPVVLVTRKLPPKVEDRLRHDYQARLNADDRLYSKDELIAQAQGAQAILPCHTEHFSADVFQQLPAEVKIIANFSVGFDHVDVEAARKKGVVVTNTPDVLSDATAELTMMLMIGAARRASEGEKLVREGKWKDWSPAFMVGTQVTGKRLGILGMGRVGQVVAKRARGFDMTIHYHDVRRLPPEKEAGAIFHETAGGPASPLRLPQRSLQRHAGDAPADGRAAVQSAARRRDLRQRGPWRHRRRRSAHRGVEVGKTEGRRHRRVQQ